MNLQNHIGQKTINYWNCGIGCVTIEIILLNGWDIVDIQQR